MQHCNAREPVGHARGGVRDARRRKFRVAHLLLRRDGRHLERIFLVVDGGGSAEDERARSTDLRTPRERHARAWDRRTPGTVIGVRLSVTRGVPGSGRSSARSD